MQTTALLQYPEFLLAGLLSIFVALNMHQQVEWHWPNWLTQPAKSCLAILPESYLIRINQLLLQANWRSNFSFGDFAACKLYIPLLAAILVLFLPLYAVCALVLLSWFAPDIFLIACVKHRQQEIHNALPQAIDLMVLCVDAGLGIDATLQRVSSDSTKIAKALNDELNILSHEILLGLDKEQAYRELYDRTGVDELKTFGSALTQASKLGLSIAKVLRSQSEFIRKKQSQKAEEKAMKMPIYMAFPLWFFIMPALMLLVLAPSLIKFYHQLHGAM